MIIEYAYKKEIALDASLVQGAFKATHYFCKYDHFSEVLEASTLNPWYDYAKKFGIELIVDSQPIVLQESKLEDEKHQE
ncbi:MAG: hypothetical protein LBB21_06520 [Holosporaceae bacterium]|jgi:hypothetical protein|nr:hypothetical protein [Holosporaceae bacterium]